VMDRVLTDGITVTNPTLGLVRIDVTPAMQVTAAVAVGLYRHEFWVVLATGAITVQVVGTLNVAPSLRREFP